MASVRSLLSLPSLPRVRLSQHVSITTVEVLPESFSPGLDPFPPLGVQGQHTFPCPPSTPDSPHLQTKSLQCLPILASFLFSLSPSGAPSHYSPQSRPQTPSPSLSWNQGSSNLSVSLNHLDGSSTSRFRFRGSGAGPRTGTSTKSPGDAAAVRTSAPPLRERSDCLCGLFAVAPTDSLLLSSHQGIPAGVPGACVPTALYLHPQVQLPTFTSSSLHILRDVPPAWRIYSRLTSVAPHNLTSNPFCNFIFYFVPVEPSCSRHGNTFFFPQTLCFGSTFFIMM